MKDDEIEIEIDRDRRNSKMKMILQLPVVWLMASSLWPWTGATTTTTFSSNAKSDCPERCGNVSVPYPFGIDHPNCAKDDNFLLTCNDSVSPPQLVFGSNIPVVDISVQDGTVSVSIHPAFDCYDKNGLSVGSFGQSITLGDGPFTFSDQRNKFTALGCDTLAFVEDSQGKLYGSGCVSLCDRPGNFTEQGSCSGVGCCQISIPKNLTTLNITLLSMNNYSDTWEFNRCGYAFLVDQNLFNFSNMNLSVYPEQMLDSRVVLDWVIGEETCENAQANVDQAGYSCGPNTNCSDSTNGPGHRCLCKEGFLGNPYLRQGCQDIDECKEREKYPCHGSCKNTVGSYTCRCPLGMHGDGKVGCQGFRVTTIATVTGASILIGIILLLIFIECKKRKKEKYFRENGGSLLKHQRVRIFSEAELAKATNNYDDSQLLGRGGTGSVYKGVLVNDIQVAIKKPKEVNKLTQMNQQFQHEIGIVSQVNHKNVVKLMGLCLETKVPLLVYEFVSNGTLFQHIHEKSSTILRTWNDRLRIAAETALALDYLHSLADPPIIHRDVKLMNILLDEKCTAKVSDFGASILIPPGQTKIDTKIVGTLGYLDPEYLITGDLTVKSDVYSFGVVLMELLTGQKPTFIQNFITSIRNDSLPQILNVGLTSHEGEMEQIEAVAHLAKRCLNRNGDKRPTMKEVADELIGLQKHIDNLWAQKNSEETESLLGESRYGFLENATGQIAQSDTHYMTAFDIEQPSVSRF